MRFAYWFSHRLSLHKGTPASSATGAVIAVAGVALALMVMELSLAVVAGFKHEIERKIMGFDAAVSVLPAYDYYTGTSAETVTLSDSLANVISPLLTPGRRAVVESTRHAIIKTDDNFLAVQCIAHGSGHNTSFLRSIMTRGSLPDFRSDDYSDSIVLSESVASKLSLAPGDRTFLYFFVNDAPKARRVFVSGLFKSNFSEYDDAIVYTSLPLLQGLADESSATGTSVAIEGVTKEEVEAVSDSLQHLLLEAYSSGLLAHPHPVNNILNRGAVFFNWLDLLDTNVVVIFVLMICVAAFTLISSLFIIILDRVQSIGILRALGATRNQVSSIFVNLALRLVGTGMAIGNILAIGIILFQLRTHCLPLDPAMYYIDYVPFELSWWTVAWLNIGIVFGAWLILILPARLASRIDPGVTMRYE